jgi:hypothetical protein
LKYKIKPFPNPRVSIPRPFEGGPSIFQFHDEQGGGRAQFPSAEWRARQIGIAAGWTVVHFDLTAPIDKQLDRASGLLAQLQANFAGEIGLAARLKEKKSRRRRKDLWPRYLQVLDARNEGQSYGNIGLALNKLEAKSTENLPQEKADALLSWIERAKSDAKKWCDAALRVANSGGG